jgi:hypothetical protein
VPRSSSSHASTATRTMPTFHLIGFSIKLSGGEAKSTHYVMSESARCPNCRCEITEKTLVDLRDEE